MYSVIVSTVGVILSAIISAAVSWKVASFNAQQKYKELHETFLHEDQARHDAHKLELEKLHEQWEHDLTSQEVTRSALKNEALYSDVRAAMGKVSAFLIHDYNMHALGEAAALVSGAAVGADGDLKSHLMQLGHALETKDLDRIRALRDLVLQDIR